jgi:basic membrane protein A
MTRRRLILTLALANAALFAIGAAVIPDPGPGPGAGIRVGMVLDIGGKNDKSFNEGAWIGLQQARVELGVQVRFIEPSGGADRESALRNLATGGYDLVIAVGYVFATELERVAAQYPNVMFAGVDYSPTEGVAPRPNLLALQFREHEGAFVVGAIAGMTTKSKIVGFVGGMQIPLIRKFEAGYEAGVKHVCKECVVTSAYAGSTFTAFTDAPKGQELAAAQFGQGADVIFHASGKTGDGVFAAARQRRKLVIGVDRDQHSSAPCCVLTSMLKRVDVAVVEVVRAVVTGEFKGGVIDHGLADGAIGFVDNEDNKILLRREVAAKARKIAEEIVAGTIKVPST